MFCSWQFGGLEECQDKSRMSNGLMYSFWIFLVLLYFCVKNFQLLKKPKVKYYAGIVMDGVYFMCS